MDDISIDHPWVDDDLADDEDDGPGTGRRWPIVIVSVLVVIVAIGAVLYVAASHYQPLSQIRNGEYGSEVLSTTGTLAANSTDVAKSLGVVWTEPSGSFRVDVIVTLNNDQRFGVAINKVMAPANKSGNSDVRVYFDSNASTKVSYGYKGGPAFKATTLASKGQLQLVVHWVQQCVPKSAQSGATTYTSLPVEYTFLGFHHTVTVPIDPVTIAPRSTC